MVINRDVQQSSVLSMERTVPVFVYSAIVVINNIRHNIWQLPSERSDKYIGFYNDERFKNLHGKNRQKP